MSPRQMTLPSPMLARSAPLPSEPRWVFEPKWDGFRCLARTGRDYQLRSRRGWNMTPLVDELRPMPRGV
jgi:ATP-dependent DNA ligase